MDNAKQQTIDRLKQANNVLVTVSTNPSVDQLAACLGLTLMLNKIGKHGAAVFSGNVPSTIEFLKPEQTLEKNTDSLRDFIIALDKSKADKLRYKVEDKIVKIFITPYHTSLTEKDLEFSQGDFNIDVVIALGVHEQADLDQAITAHGRILHDATVISLNVTANDGNLGSIVWQNTAASSLSEMVTQLGLELDKNILDPQIGTALLTGIVAATNRFSNEKTSSNTMNVSAQLVTAGANPQLVANELQEAVPPPPPPPPDEPLKPAVPPPPPPPPITPSASVAKTDNGTLNIEHESKDDETQIDIDSQGVLHLAGDTESPGPLDPSAPPDAVPPLAPEGPATNEMTDNSKPEESGPTADALSLPPTNPPILSRDSAPALPGAAFTTAGPVQSTPPTDPTPAITPTPASSVVPPVVPAGPDLTAARNAVEQAVASGPTNEPLQPIAALNAQPVFENLQAQQPALSDPPRPRVVSPIPSSSTLSHHTTIEPLSGGSNPLHQPLPEQLDTMNMPLPSDPFSVPDQVPDQAIMPPEGVVSSAQDSTVFAPPPVPPPMMPMYEPGQPQPPVL